MKLIVPLSLCLLLFGCAGAPQTMLTSSDSTRTVTYGPYFENEKFSVADTILVDAVITLGRERLPKDYKPERELYYSDGEVEEVLEFYFTNLTDKNVEIRLADFQWGFSHKITPEVVVIPPKKYIKSDPVIAVTSNYRTQPEEYAISLMIDGVPHPIKDTLRRMTLDQLKERHGKKAN